MYTDDNGIDHFYEDQTDNYVQKNYQLLFNHNFTSAWNVNAGLHYTKGDGYYQEYKDGRELVEYGLLPYEHDGETVNESDLIRKKQWTTASAAVSSPLIIRVTAFTHPSAAG